MISDEEETINKADLFVSISSKILAMSSDVRTGVF
jgi:hypothetical protein